MSYPKIIISLIIALIGIYLPKEILAENREELENLCIADIIKRKARQGMVVSSAGIVNTCRFTADYIIENNTTPPYYLLPKYSQVDVDDMRESFYGEW